MANPIRLIQSVRATGTGTTITATLPSAAVAGRALIVVASARGAAPMTSTLGPDARSNVYNLDGQEAVSTDQGSPDYKLLEVWSTRIVTGGAISVTYTVSASATALTLQIQEWDGLYPGIVYGSSPGAGWIDKGFAVGAAPFGSITLAFASDYPYLASYYGTALPVLGISATFTDVLAASYTYFPSATQTVNIAFPAFIPGALACALIVLYVGPTGPVPPPPPEPGAESLSLDLWVWRELHTFEAVTDDLNFPPGYPRALMYALAIEMFDQYPRAKQKYDFKELLADGDGAVRDLELINDSNAVAKEPTT